MVGEDVTGIAVGEDVTGIAVSSYRIIDGTVVIGSSISPPPAICNPEPTEKPSSKIVVVMKVGCGDEGNVVGEYDSGSNVIAGTVSSFSSTKTRAVLGVGVGVYVVGMLSDILRELRSRGTPM